MMDKLKETCLFFRSSPLRDALLINIIEVNVPNVGKRKPLLDLCKTRWSARHEAYQHFYQSYCYIIKCLEVMSFGLHKDEGYNDELTNCWNRENNVRATALLNELTQYEFIVTFLTVYKVLSRLEGVTVKLQTKMQDIFDALDVIEEVKSVYQEMRKNVEEYFNVVFLHSERMAEAVGQTSQMPRIVGRQIHKSNVKAATPKEYYFKNLAIPFLDNVNMEIDTQFSVLSTKCMKLFALVPSILFQKSMKVSDLQEVVDLYENDLPSPELFDEEFFAWKLKSQQMQERPSTCRNAIKLCAKEHFPNIYVLLKIACTLPITSCERERSFSVMRRLNNYMRASMNHDRLSSLALLHIHYDTELSTAEVIEKFACLHPRRLELKNIIYN
ncbi:Hypothetical predicted protein [Mytilus galloprovincialis]|uniref:HAT C-terminal dimerisation domain-containing protein n=1 Tax=Mytilus galloprovincialis TaxID=29158 RepID=A0A8B6ENZ8_MYTGA|nr:Hypothetical predicted protein [Mytilus galloprovincialis]